MKKLWLPVLLAAALAGCATAEGQRDNGAWMALVNPARSENDRLLDYHARLTQLKPQDLGPEYESVRKSYERQPSDFQRIQLAMLLSLPGATFRDNLTALALLQSWTKDKRNETSSLKPIAMMMRSYLLDMRRSDDAMQTQAGKLRDEQRRAQALQQKLEALLEMEMKMIEREQDAQSRKR